MENAMELEPAPPSGSYWANRKDSIYLFAAQEICRKYCPAPISVMDVGSNETPTLEWHRDTARELVSLDLRRPYSGPGVTSVTADFLKHDFGRTFDLVTCFQVLEHVRKAADFARRLLDVGSVVVVSVPYKWRKGACKYHVHDPVDEAKMLRWFGKKPRFSYVATELNRVARLISVYMGVKG